MVNGKAARQARLDQDYGMAFQQAGLFEWRTVTKQHRAAPGAARVGTGPAARPGRRRCWPWSSCRSSRATTPGSCRAACSSGWPSPGRWPFDPPLLLMDEPFGALDEMTREHMQAELIRICEATGTTVVFVTHSIPEAVFLSDRVVVMSARPGRIVGVVEVDLGHARRRHARELPEFFKKVTEVREALRGVRGRRRRARCGPLAVTPGVLPPSVAPAVSGCWLAWQLFVQVRHIKPYLLPAPSAIWHQIVTNRRRDHRRRPGHGHQRPDRVAGGTSLGIVAGVLASRFRILGELTTPLAVALTAIPIVALVPIFNNMFSTTSAIPRRLMVTIVVFFPSSSTRLRG